jgi:hypothetical protein
VSSLKCRWIEELLVFEPNGYLTKLLLQMPDKQVVFLDGKDMTAGFQQRNC